MAAGSACPILAGNKANIVITGTQTCLPIYLLSFSFGEETGWRGARFGWQWQIKPVTFSSFLFLCCFVAKLHPAQSKAVVLSSRCHCDKRLVFTVIKKKNTREKFTSISHSSSLHHLSLSFPLLLFHSLASLWFLIYVAMWPHSIDSACFLIIPEAEGTIASASGSHRLRNGVIMSLLQKTFVYLSCCFPLLCF